MQISQFIIVKKKDRQYGYTSRLTQNMPALQANEVAVKVTLSIPDAIFKKPALEAQITIPESAVSKPTISAEVVDNVEQIIKQQTGFDVKLEIIEKPQGE